MKLETRIREQLAILQPQSLEIADESHLHIGHGATGAHLRLSIRSARFNGLTPVQRHRLIYEALGTLIGKEIHALGIEANATEESCD